MRSSAEMTSGGASRIVEPWVSLASTPRAISASQTIRPVPIRGVDVDAGPQAAGADADHAVAEHGLEPLAQQDAELGGAGLVLAGAEHLDHGRPTAHASGLPPKVLPCWPGRSTPRTSLSATIAETGTMPPPSALPRM